jgi:hypothetical protein
MSQLPTQMKRKPGPAPARPRRARAYAVVGVVVTLGMIGYLQGYEMRDLHPNLSQPATMAVGGGAAGGADLMKELELATSDVPEIQPALKQHGLLTMEDIVEFLTEECGGVTAGGLKQMGIRAFGTRKRVLQALLKKQQAPAEADEDKAKKEAELNKEAKAKAKAAVTFPSSLTEFENQDPNLSHASSAGPGPIHLLWKPANVSRSDVCTRMCSEEDMAVHLIESVGNCMQSLGVPPNGGHGYLENLHYFSDDSNKVSAVSVRVNASRYTGVTVWSTFECRQTGGASARALSLPENGYHLWCCGNFVPSPLFDDSTRCSHSGTFSHRIALAGLDSVTKMFKTHEIPISLGAGTLLGAVRDGRIMCWEYDCEMAMLSPEQNDTTYTPSSGDGVHGKVHVGNFSKGFVTLYHALLEKFPHSNGVAIQKFLGKYRPTQLDVMVWSGGYFEVHVAINFILPGHARLACPACADSDLVFVNAYGSDKGWILPAPDWDHMEQAYIDHRSFPVLGHPRDWLKRLYGDDWNVPQAGCHAGQTCPKGTMGVPA